MQNPVELRNHTLWKNRYIENRRRDLKIPAFRLSKKSLYRKRDDKSKMRFLFINFMLSYKMTPDSSRNRRHCLLFPQSLSTVPLYADESDYGKSNFLFRHLPACRYFIDTLKGPQLEVLFSSLMPMKQKHRHYITASCCQHCSKALLSLYFHFPAGNVPGQCCSFPEPAQLSFFQSPQAFPFRQRRQTTLLH